MPTQDEQPIINPEEEASDEEFRAALAAAEKAAQIAMVTAVKHLDEMQAIDSLQANEFHIELEGEPVTGVFSVTGLTSFTLSRESAPITLAKMVQRDASLPMNQWLRETVESKGLPQRPMRTLDVVAVDDGEETRRWTLHNAYITEVRYSAFDTSSSNFVEEILTITCERIDEAWTWSDSQ